MKMAIAIAVSFVVGGAAGAAAMSYTFNVPKTQLADTSLPVQCPPVSPPLPVQCPAPPDRLTPAMRHFAAPQSVPHHSQGF